MTPGTCDSCDRFGPLVERDTPNGEGSFCPSCYSRSDVNVGDAWSDAYADLHDDLKAANTLLGETREVVAEYGIEYPSITTIKELLARIDAHMKEKR